MQPGCRTAGLRRILILGLAAAVEHLQCDQESMFTAHRSLYHWIMVDCYHKGPPFLCKKKKETPPHQPDREDGSPGKSDPVLFFTLCILLDFIFLRSTLICG